MALARPQFDKATMKFAEGTEIAMLTVKPENIIKMPLGLMGFEQIKQFVLLSKPDEAPFGWLQVVGDENLAFLVVSPFDVLPGYQPDVSDEDARFLGLEGPGDALVYGIVTLRGTQGTVNLKGPVILNRRTLVGKQVVIMNAAEYSLQQPLAAQA